MKKVTDRNEKNIEDFKNKKLERVVKRARWQTILRNILISFLVFCVLCVLCVAAWVSISIYKSRQQVALHQYMYAIDSISFPNKYAGIYTEKSVPAFSMGQKIKTGYTTYKIIEGKIVYTGNVEWESTFSFRNSSVLIMRPSIMDYNFIDYYITENYGYRRYNEFGHRVMVFFYPFLTYETIQPLNDLSLLDDIGNEKYMEMALSFDREYTIDEVEKMFPGSTTVTWYWVDDLSKNEKKVLEIPAAEREKMSWETESPYIDMPDVRSEFSRYRDIPEVRSEYTAYGVKLYDSNGNKISDFTNPVTLFINLIEAGRDAYKHESVLDNIYKNMAGDDGKLTKDDIRVLGAVVTGNAESLKSLRDLPFIRASSLGVITDKY